MACVGVEDPSSGMMLQVSGPDFFFHSWPGVIVKIIDPRAQDGEPAILTDVHVWRAGILMECPLTTQKLC